MYQTMSTQRPEKYTVTDETKRIQEQRMVGLHSMESTPSFEIQARTKRFQCTPEDVQNTMNIVVFN